MNFAQTLQSSFANDQNKYKSIVKDNSQLKKTKFASAKFDFSNCPITMEDFKEGDDIICLPCNHIFEPDGIIKWVTNENASCPVCRFKLKSKKVTNAAVTSAAMTNAAVTSAAVTSAAVTSAAVTSAAPSEHIDLVLNRLTGFMNNNLSIIGSRNINDLSTSELIDINQNFNHILHTLRNRNNELDSIINSSIQEENDNDLQMAIIASLNNN